MQQLIENLTRLYKLAWVSNPRHTNRTTTGGIVNV